MPAAPHLPLFHNPDHAAHAPSLEYDTGGCVDYPERPARVDYLLAGLAGVAGVELRAWHSGPPEHLLYAVHDAAYLDYLSRAAALPGSRTPDGYLYPIVFPRARRPDRLPQAGDFALDAYAPIGPHTWQAALTSAGVTVAAAQSVLAGETQFAYALCRPPGHHAGRGYSAGYCYLNNAALAAEALRQHGRVAVLDIDYHHGNGTQELLWDDPDTLFVSLHADPLAEYPYYSGFADERGGHTAPGTTLNLPLPFGTDDATWLSALGTALAAIRAFEPAALVISLGFDAYIGDPMGRFDVTLAGFDATGSAIAALGLPTVLVQEGGYASAELGEVAAAFCHGLLRRAVAMPAHRAANGRQAGGPASAVRQNQT